MYLRFLLSCGIMSLILITSITLEKSFAAQMEAFLIPEADKSEPVFTNIRFINIKYEPGSELSKIFSGKNDRIMFTLNSTDPGMDELQKAVNEAVLVEKNSPIQLSNSKLEYTAQIKGDESKVVISYKVKFDPVVSDFVLPSNGTTKVVDLDWRSVSVKGPLTVQAPEFGNFDVNYPIAAIQAKYPEAAAKLLSSEEIKMILETPLFNWEEIGLPMDRWHFLFDPTGSQAGAVGSGYAEEGGAKVVSVFSLGESSIREGTHAIREETGKGAIDGSEVMIKTSNPPPSGQIQIGGFAKIQTINGAEVAFISPQGPEGAVAATGGFPFQVLLILGGLMGAVAVLVLLKARKKDDDDEYD